MIHSAFIQSNQKIIHRSVIEENFESMIHHFNNCRVSDEGKLKFKNNLIYYLSQSGSGSTDALNINNLVLGIVTNDDLIHEIEIPSVLRNIIGSIDFDPFVQIEDTVLLLDSVISNLGISNFKPDTLQAIRLMDSYDEKIHNIARANKEMEGKLKRELIEGVKTMQVAQIPPQINQQVISNQFVQQPKKDSSLKSKKEVSAELFKKHCDDIKNKQKKNKRNENLQFTVYEKIKIQLDKEGKILKNEIVGELLMYMSNSDLKEGKIKIKTNYECKFSPNLDREDAKRSILRPRNTFPVEKSVPLVRWQREADFDDFTFSLWETEKEEESDKKEKNTDIIMDYEKKHDISEIIFFFNTRGKNLTENCKNRGVNLIWQSEKESESIEFTAQDSIFPIRVFYVSNRKCQFDVLSVETGKKSDEQFDTEYLYEVDSVEIVE